MVRYESFYATFDDEWTVMEKCGKLDKCGKYELCEVNWRRLSKAFYLTS